MHNTKNYSDQGGDRWAVEGQLEVTTGGQLILTSPNGTKYQIVVDDTGVLSAVAL